MHLRTGIEIHLASNTRQAPEVLVLEIRAVAPAHDLHGDEVFTLLQILSDVELGSHLRVLAISHITTIDPKLEVARSRTDMEEHLLTTPAVGQEELATITARIVIGLANKWWIIVERRTPGISYILVDGIAMTIQLKQSWNGEILPTGIVVVEGPEASGSILMVLDEMEAPHALHREITLRLRLQPTSGKFFILVGEEVGSSCLTVLLVHLRITPLGCVVSNSRRGRCQY